MSVSPLTTFDRIRAIWREQLGVEDEEITLHAHMINDLGADSLDVIEIVMALEQEFDITIAEVDAQRIQTVEDAVRLIDRVLDEIGATEQGDAVSDELIGAVGAVIRGVNAAFAEKNVAIGTGTYVQDLLQALRADGLSVVVTTDTEEELERVRQQFAQSCACQHDGRGELTSECDEHQQIRHERDRLKKAVENIRMAAALGLSYGNQATPQSLEKMVGGKEQRLREVIRYCEAVGVVGSVLRGDPPTPPSAIVPTLHDLQMRADWYRAGCEGIEDRDCYLRHGLAADAAADLQASISIATHLLLEAAEQLQWWANDESDEPTVVRHITASRALAERIHTALNRRSW